MVVVEFPVVLLLCLVRWRRLKSGKIVEFRVSEMTPVGDGGFRCIVGCTPALITEAVKAMEAWATRGYSVVGVKHVVNIRCCFFFGLPVVGLWVWIFFGLGFCLGFPILVT